MGKRRFSLLLRCDRTFTLIYDKNSAENLSFINLSGKTRGSVMRIFLVCGLLSIAVATNAFALSDLENLKGKVIAYAGEFDAVDCPISGKYDCSAWPITMLKTRRGPEICFGSDKYVRCNYQCSGLIGVGEDKVAKVYVLDAVGGATEISFHQYQCPPLF